MSDYTEYFLEGKMDSSEGEELKAALEATIAEEKLCLEQFKFQINHCIKQINIINKVISAGKGSHDLVMKKKAFEEEKTILNVAAQCQLCSFETKEKQKQLYFEKDEHQRARLAAEASVLMYERCDDFQQLTGKQFQELAERLLAPSDIEAFREARKQLGDFYKQERTSLSNVRHNVGAHRDLDFMNQMDVLEGIKWSETIERLHRFEVVTLAFGKAMKPLMDAGLKQIGKAFGEG